VLINSKRTSSQAQLQFAALRFVVHLFTLFYKKL
jgi:hypothetical protein